MYEPKIEKEIKCPIEYGLDIFGGCARTRIDGHYCLQGYFD